MEFAFFRSFVVLLALTGFSSAFISHTTTTSTKTTVKANGVVGGPGAACPPNDPNYCGLQ